MINNITTSMDIQTPINVSKADTSRLTLQLPPLLSFKTPLLKEKATLRVKKFKRADNIMIMGEIDDDYVDVVEEEIAPTPQLIQQYNFFQRQLEPIKKKTKYLKNCYIIDYIQSPRSRCGLGTEALKGLVEKAMFDERANGRIVTFSSPVCRESSPAIFFYKLGFRFVDPAGNEYIKDCINKKIPDVPPQVGMMYLPRAQMHKLLRYGDMF